MKKILSVALAVMLLCAVLAACGGAEQTPAVQAPPVTAPPAPAPTQPAITPTEAPTPEPITEPATMPEPEPVLTFGSNFEFDDFAIQIGYLDNVLWGTVNNRFSDLDGETVFKVPVTMTNNGTESGRLNTFRYNFFGSNGTRLDTVSSFFRDYCISRTDMRPGASAEGYFIFLFDGDGDYFIEFSRSRETLEVHIPMSQ